jgi:eukaryotic-like serine/threonine-protein kinase
MRPEFPVLNLQPFDAGGNGDLYLGQWRANGATVVVKFLREFKDPHARQGFRQQVQILNRRVHGVVQLLYADTEAERPYYVMPYLGGGQLSRYAGRLDAKRAHTVALDLARTLSNFHAMVGSHGDYKPANLLVSCEGELRVADPSGNGFGCTMFLPQNHGGTPGYWAPEVAAGGISREGDVYSFGATLYELITGEPPRDGQRFEPNRWQERSAPKLWEVIRCCCQASPKARPSMQEVVRMLEGASWAQILETRRRTEGLLKMAGVATGIFLLARLFGG